MSEEKCTFVVKLGKKGTAHTTQGMNQHTLYNNKGHRRPALRALLLATASLLLLTLTSCNGKQEADQRWVDSILQVCDTMPDDTLAYIIEDAPLSAAVDENFIDFFYTFTHNPQFQRSRITLPFSIKGHDGEELRRITTHREFLQEFALPATDCYVLLMNSDSELGEQFSNITSEAELQLVNLAESKISNFIYSRTPDGPWMMTGGTEEPFSTHPLGEFLTFYNAFSSDSAYQVAHLAKEVAYSEPAEEIGEEPTEGTIDPEQFPSFAPEAMPKGKMLIMNAVSPSTDPQRIVMAVCEQSSGMMDILTFEHEEGQWKLTRLER